jgi:hypothetical protein
MSTGPSLPYQITVTIEAAKQRGEQDSPDRDLYARFSSLVMLSTVDDMAQVQAHLITAIREVTDQIRSPE